MKQTSERSAGARRPLWVLLSTVAVVTALLLWAVPRQAKFGYDFQLDKPWRYQQLIASYDFPIFKSDEELQAERDSLESRFKPYYRVDSLCGPLAIRRFVEHAAEVHARQSAAARGAKPSDWAPGALQALARVIQNTYNRGVVDAAEASSLSQRARGSQPELRLLSGTTTTARPLADFMTTRQAYDYIMEKGAEYVPQAELAELGLARYLRANIVPDTAKIHLELEAELSTVLAYHGMVQSGQLIIDRGQIVTAERYKILESMKRESLRRMNPTRGYWLLLLGQALYVLCVIGCLVVYLWLYRRDYLQRSNCLLLLFSLVGVFPLITCVMMQQQFLSVYIVPYATVPVLVRIFLDSRTAFMALVGSTLLSALSLHAPFEFIVMELSAGVAAIFSLRELTERSQLLRTACYTVVAAAVMTVAYDLSQGMEWEAFDRSRLLFIATSGVALLFVHPFMYVIERVFGFVSGVTLIELNNINHPILRRMSKEAQGTLQHSLQVANLAAEVADKIGANAQLVRTGALYHDIGKTATPAFFTENQTGTNPHDQLREAESARIIVGHVARGLQLAEKYHLPSQISDFIRTHHGRGLVKYFYVQACNKSAEGPEAVDRQLFTYPGPNPQTREQAILMMCDAVEAASRSLKEYTEESLAALVEKIVNLQLEAGFFAECPLTFRDVAQAKQVLSQALKTIYHTRIAYPELRQGQRGGAAPRAGFFSGWQRGKTGR